MSIFSQQVFLILICVNYVCWSILYICPASPVSVSCSLPDLMRYISDQQTEREHLDTKSSCLCVGQTLTCFVCDV